MSRIGTAICMLFVLAESIPVFAAKLDIDQAPVKSEADFPIKSPSQATTNLPAMLSFLLARMESTFFPKMSH